MIPLPQSGRAGLQFMGDLQVFASTELRDRAKAAFFQRRDMKRLGNGPLSACNANDIDAIVAHASEAAKQIQDHRFNRLYQRLVAEAVYDRGIPAAEEKRDQVIAPGDADTPPHANSGTLKLDPALEIPAYAAGVEWHLMPGGWDGYDLSPLMFKSGIMPYVFSKGGYAAVDVGADIFAQRMDVLDQLPEREYLRIYDCGCGGIPTLSILRKKFPDAELVGADLSGGMLAAGHRIDQQTGLNVHLKQEDCRATSEPDNHYDAVIAYAVFHETPDDVCRDILAEMHRILAPGGHILISDPAPLRALDAYQAVLLDWEQDNREEPHFGASIRRNLPEVLLAAGFAKATEFGIGNGTYPWVTIGTKSTE